MSGKDKNQSPFQSLLFRRLFGLLIVLAVISVVLPVFANNSRNAASYTGAWSEAQNSDDYGLQYTITLKPGLNSGGSHTQLVVRYDFADGSDNTTEPSSVKYPSLSALGNCAENVLHDRVEQCIIYTFKRSFAETEMVFSFDLPTETLSDENLIITTKLVENGATVQNDKAVY